MIRLILADEIAQAARESSSFIFRNRERFRRRQAAPNETKISMVEMENKVPKFIDHHAKMPPMPPEMMEQGKRMLEQMANDIIARKADEFGVTPLNVYVGEGGESWCYTEAPNAEAVVKAHAAKGAQITKADVIEVQPLV